MTIEIPATSALKCPLDGCSWEHAEPASEVPLGALAGMFGFGVMTAVAQHQHAGRVERAAEVHFNGHKVEDFLRTITRLQQQGMEMARAMAAMEEACRGHH